MSSNESKWAQTSVNEPKWAESQNGHKWAQKTLNILKMILYELKIGLNELKWVSLNSLKRDLNELEWALISSNVNKRITSDAYRV